MFPMEGRLKMIRPTLVRPAALLSALLLSIFAAACSSGGSNAPSTNAANTSNVSNANASNANVSNANANTASSANSVPAADAAQAKLDVNTASESDLLKTIPGFGKRMAHEFEEYRPYKSVQQFRREIGKYVDAKQIAEYEKYVYVPISVNDADAPTLQQIPGLDATEAQALINARPFASNDAFLSKLAGSVSEAELAVAKTYLSKQ
jgi:DNA uptake protein ComE-like DNA-binding protein